MKEYAQNRYFLGNIQKNKKCFTKRIKKKKPFRE